MFCELSGLIPQLLQQLGNIYLFVISQAQTEIVTLSHRSIWSPSGVHLESTWTSLKWSNCVLLKNPAGLHVYSRYTPLGVLIESTRSDTFPGLLKKSFNTGAGFCPDSTSNPFKIPNLI